MWEASVTIEEINTFNKGTMVEHLGIEFTEISENSLTATMPVDHRTLQPYGIMHGGASAALAETVGSIASNFCVDQNTHYCVGLDINTSHLKMAKNGFVTGVAKPIHIGRTTHVWEVRIYDEAKALISQSRLTMMVLRKNRG
ncbi:MAG: hotdog fold thioesterase [Chlamydiota bacterium]|nr:hotdog fold thioesterase [Chlamydiota bacterium]